MKQRETDDVSKEADEAAAQSWGLIIEIARLLRSSLKGVERVSETQLRLLRELDKVNGPIRLKDLAEAVRLSPPTVCQAIDALVGLGVIERCQDAEDRRAVAIRLTSAGCRGRDFSVNYFTSKMQELLHGVTSAEQATFLKVLRHVWAGLDAPSVAASGNVVVGGDAY